MICTDARVKYWGSVMTNAPDRHTRAILPIPDRPAPGLTTYDAKDPDTAYPPIEPLRPPAGAPNVLIVLLDDIGFGASSAFGGPCQTPNFERLAANGLKYNRFHTTALCAPTRQALLTGRNHHAAGMGGIPGERPGEPEHRTRRRRRHWRRTHAGSRPREELPDRCAVRVYAR